MTKVESAKKDVAKYDSIAALTTTAGGKVIIESLKKDITNTIEEITSKYKTASHIEMIAMSAKLSEKLSLLRTFNRAKLNKKIALEDLDFILKEEAI